MSYEDPENTVEIMNQLQNECKTMKEVFDKIEETFPGLIYAITPKYCDDYPHLTGNWHQVLAFNEARQHRKGLVVLFKIREWKESSLVGQFAELLTFSGCSVRTWAEFHLCPKCQSAIPSEPMYHLMKEQIKGLNLPATYSMLCTKCK